LTENGQDLLFLHRYTEVHCLSSSGTLSQDVVQNMDPAVRGTLSMFGSGAEGFQNFMAGGISCQFFVEEFGGNVINPYFQQTDVPRWDKLSP